MPEINQPFERNLTPKRRGWRLIQKKECWTLTWRARLALLGIVVFGTVFGAGHICSFFALSHPNGEGILAAEGWLPDYVIQVAIDAFHTNHYQRVLVPGGRVAQGFYLSEYKTWARLGEVLFKNRGMPAESVVAIESLDVQRDRTYACGLAAKRWLMTNYPSIKKIDVVSLGVHTRRTRLLYQKAFGPDYEIGSIAVPDKDYDPKHWWRTSAGFRIVTSEIIAYLYARFLFHPDNQAK